MRDRRFQIGTDISPNYYDFLRAKIMGKFWVRCMYCFNRAEHVHHMNMNKDDHSFHNLILVCGRCHTALHRDYFVSKSRNGKYKHITVKSRGLLMHKWRVRPSEPANICEVCGRMDNHFVNRRLVKQRNVCIDCFKKWKIYQSFEEDYAKKLGEVPRVVTNLCEISEEGGVCDG